MKLKKCLFCLKKELDLFKESDFLKTMLIKDKDSDSGSLIYTIVDDSIEGLLKIEDYFKKNKICYELIDD